MFETRSTYYLITMAPTTEFDQLMKFAFSKLFPGGSARNAFRACAADDCYQKIVKPDYVIDGTKWIDFKLKVSYREKSDVPWRPSALYASLRKYVDHVCNPTNSLIIVYGKLYGTVDDVVFPIKRGEKVLIRDREEFIEKVKLVSAQRVLEKLRGTEHDWVLRKLTGMLR